MDLSIVIVSYNTKDLLKECLRSVYKNTGGLNHEIIVSDNGSIDGTIEMIKNEFPRVRLIKNGENLGFPKANNKGMEAAKGDFVLLLNPDTVILSGSLILMMNFMKENPEAGAVASRLLNADGSNQPSVSKFPDLFTLFVRFCVPRFVSGKIKELLANSNLKKKLGSQINSYFSLRNVEAPTEVDDVSGACLLIRRKTMEEVGFLDNKFFLYCEDIDWCYRARKKGWKIIYLPAAKVIHYGGKATGGDFKPFPLCCGIESEYYFFKKHYNNMISNSARILLIFALLGRAPWFLYRHFYPEKGDKYVKINLLKKYFLTFKNIIIGSPYGR